MNRRVLLFSGAAAAAAATSLKVGDVAPDFKLPSTTGKPITLAEFRGQRAVVLAFFPAAFTGG
jgi:peroxiredoxin